MPHNYSKSSPLPTKDIPVITCTTTACLFVSRYVCLFPAMSVCFPPESNATLRPLVIFWLINLCFYVSDLVAHIAGDILLGLSVCLLASPQIWTSIVFFYPYNIVFHIYNTYSLCQTLSDHINIEPPFDIDLNSGRTPGLYSLSF